MLYNDLEQLTRNGSPCKKKKHTHTYTPISIDVYALYVLCNDVPIHQIHTKNGEKKKE